MTRSIIMYSLLIAAVVILAVKLYKITEKYNGIVDVSKREIVAIDSVLTVIRSDKKATYSTIDSGLLKIDSIKNIMKLTVDTTITYEDAIKIINGK